MSFIIEKLNQNPINKSDVRFAWFGQCGFVFRYNNKTVLIDAMLNDSLNSKGKSHRYYPSPISAGEVSCDFYFATHYHLDHFAEPTACEIYKNNPKCKFIVPAGLAPTLENCGINKENIIPVGCDEEIVLSGGIKFNAVSAAHPKHIYDKSNREMALSYVIWFGDKKVMHLGDTYYTDILENTLMKFKTPDLLLPPINGRACEVMPGFIGNMNAIEASRLACILGARMTMPTHFDMFKGNTADPSEFLVAMEEETRKTGKKIGVHIPVIGEVYSL